MKALSGIAASLLSAGLVAGSAVAARGHLPLEAVHLLRVSDVDHQAIAAEDAARDQQGLPLRFAVPNEVSATPHSHGSWASLPGERLLWQLRVFAEGSAHLNLGFDQFELPRSAVAHVSSIDGLDGIGPLTAADAGSEGGFWTPIVLGEEILIEIAIDRKDRAALEDGLRLTWVNAGYRGLGAAPQRGQSESCNIDVACSEADAWRDEIASVGVYTVQGSWTCTGFMVNNTAEDERPLFMTADHCGIRPNNDHTVVVYWNHENSYCREPGSGDSGGVGDGPLSAYTTGCTRLVGNSTYDTMLVELSSPPDPSWGVSFAGWSRSNSAANGAGIHHPECAEKRISFPDSTTMDGTYWRVNWDAGRTAPGSSGSPLFDANHRAIGQLCCGGSYCWNDDDDYYGRGFAGAWSALDAYLDPAGSNPTGIDTRLPGGGNGTPEGACCMGGQCSYVTEQACNASGGTYLGDYVTCAGNPCSPNNGNTCQTAALAMEGPNDFDTTSATDSGFGDPDESQCDDTFLDWDASPDHWFKWIATGTGTLDLTTCDASSYDTSLVVYEGPTCDDLIQIACNGDADDADATCQEYYSQVLDLEVTSGQMYWMRLGGWQAGTGAGTLTLTFNGTADPTGGCCTGITCTVMTEAVCAGVGGTYLGDGTDCSADPCGQTAIGGCCLSGTCEVMAEADCDTAGGIYLGDDTDCSGNPCGGGGGDAIDIRWIVRGTDLLSSGAPSYTVDVYAELPVGWRLDAVAGNTSQPKTIASTTGFFQSPYGGPTSVEVNPDFIPIAPDLEWDSRVTIGCIDASGDPFSSNALNTIGIDWTEFESGGSLAADNGTWFCLMTDPQGERRAFTDTACDERGGVLIARLTSLEHDSEILFEALFQGRDASGETWQDTASALITWQGEQDCNANRIPDACDIAGGESNDANGNGVPDECESGCDWDLDGDGVTGVDDLLILIGGFGQTYDVDDLLSLLAEYGCGL
ncbi:MAG: hypothetical protein QF733_00895 [Phycisphaerales bacterium]|jgi:hypothetical protein|nr:hypothetical protein [Phycisphaerales bacterium]